MPYIKPNERSIIDSYIDALCRQLAECRINTTGVLNYAITRMCDWFALSGSPTVEAGRMSYDHGVNAVMGILACVQAEYYRRRAVPYEDIKALENGDVFGDLTPELRTDDWSDEEDEQLEHMASCGMPICNICRTLRRSERDVINRMIDNKAYL